MIAELPPPQNVQKRVLLEASIVRVRSDDTHRNQNRAGREGSSSPAMGVRAIMGIHRGEVNHYGNGPQTAGATAEYPHTGSTSSTNSEFQNTVEPLLTDTSLIRTVHLVPGKCPYILCKNNLYNTDPL